jgi:ribosomal protein S18 acetylase RimI-like enzyme
MKIKFRRSKQDDLDAIYDLHCKCFSNNDHWYKSSIKHYLDKGIIIELVNNDIIGILLQGTIIPCNKRLTDDSDYLEDIFEPLTNNGKIFLTNNIHYNNLYGIVMICIDPKYRGKGLAKKLIEKHWKDNNNKLVCLNTRKSNITAFMLYKSMGYEHIAYIKNKYFLPTEDSIFMIKDYNLE